MSGTVWYLLLALVSAVAFPAGWRLGRRRAAAVVGWGVALGVLLFKAVLNHRPDWEFALIRWPHYVYLQSWLVFPIGLFCLGLAARLVPLARNARALMVLAVFVWSVSLWTERWFIADPDTSSVQRAGPNHHCIQSTSYTCGPASCVSVLSYLGVAATEGELVGACRTPPQGGTSLYRLWWGLTKLLPANYQAKIVSADEFCALGTLGVQATWKIHAIGVVFDGPDAIIHDPARTSPRRMSRADYAKEYGGPAVAIIPRTSARP